jgi:hypothetical protein
MLPISYKDGFVSPQNGNFGNITSNPAALSPSNNNTVLDNPVQSNHVGRSYERSLATTANLPGRQTISKGVRFNLNEVSDTALALFHFYADIVAHVPGGNADLAAQVWVGTDTGALSGSANVITPYRILSTGFDSREAQFEGIVAFFGHATHKAAFGIRVINTSDTNIDVFYASGNLHVQRYVGGFANVHDRRI